jgi:hypothetical protein
VETVCESEEEYQPDNEDSKKLNPAFDGKPPFRLTTCVDRL